MHIGTGGIIHEYKQDLRIYFDNVRGRVPNNHLLFFVNPSNLHLSSGFCFTFLLYCFEMGVFLHTCSLLPSECGQLDREDAQINQYSYKYSTLAKHDSWSYQLHLY